MGGRNSRGTRGHCCRRPVLADVEWWRFLELRNQPGSRSSRSRIRRWHLDRAQLVGYPMGTQRFHHSEERKQQEHLRSLQQHWYLLSARTQTPQDLPLQDPLLPETPLT